MISSGIKKLPSLRQDLKLLPESSDENGAPRWLLFDALQNRYHALSQRGLQLLEAWRAGLEADKFLAELAQRGVNVAPRELEDFVVFLSRNELLEARGEAGSDALVRRKAERARPAETSLLKSYLFFRIPLLHPDPILRRTLRAVKWTYSGWMQWLTLLVGVLGLNLTLRQWDAFLVSFRDAFSLSGAISFLFAIVVIKLIHELAHGYTARRLGCRVASIGVAFIVMFPILYTDTTDTWRLANRFKRLKVVTAGLKSELYLAAWATLFWALLPDGQARSIAFYIATTGWISSALVNLSPLLRFDGYYAFSDLLGMENLQARGFALGRWYLRKQVFGFADPVPEALPPEKCRLVLAYAYLTWIYRFFVFLGIALLVYHLAFKLLGMFLFVVEIYWFIARPVFKEIAVWWRRRYDARWSLTKRLIVVVLLMALSWAAWPMQRAFTVPAVLYADALELRAPHDAVLMATLVEDNTAVSPGQEIFHLAAPALSATQARLGRELAGVDAQIEVNAVRRGALPLLRERRFELAARLFQVTAQIKENTVLADHAGKFRLELDLSQGQWVERNALLGRIFEPEKLRIYALVADTKLTRLDRSKPASFISPWPRRTYINKIPLAGAFTPVQVLPFGELSLSHGGTLKPSVEGEPTKLKTPHMAIELKVPDATQIVPRHRLRGRLQLHTLEESLLMRWGRQLGRVLWQEFQF